MILNHILQEEQGHSYLLKLDLIKWVGNIMFLKNCYFKKEKLCNKNMQIPPHFIIKYCNKLLSEKNKLNTN